MPPTLQQELTKLVRDAQQQEHERIVALRLIQRELDTIWVLIERRDDRQQPANDLWDRYAAVEVQERRLLRTGEMRRWARVKAGIE